MEVRGWLRLVVIVFAPLVLSNFVVGAVGKRRVVRCDRRTRGGSTGLRRVRLHG